MKSVDFQMQIAPLTPADCDLRDFAFMPLDVHRLLSSETWILGTGDERAAAMTLWLASWHQVPAGSIPKDDRMLAHLSQSGAKWKKVKPHAIRGWIEASDGRLYHPVVAEKALEAWVEKLAFSLSGSAGNAKRWGVSIETDPIRERAKAAITMLRTLAPQSKLLKKKAVAGIESGSHPDSGGDSGCDDKSSGVDTSDSSGGDSGGDRKGQGQGQGLLTTTTPDGVVAASHAGNPPVGRPQPTARPECPHQQIIALYHEILPECPQVRDWTPTRAQQLRARWNEDPRRQNLDYWRQYFEYVKTCGFLVGRGIGDRPFLADLEWLTKSKNFTKVREGKYE
jgi:hypothetical protein